MGENMVDWVIVVVEYQPEIDNWGVVEITEKTKFTKYFEDRKTALKYANEVVNYFKEEVK